VQQAIGMVESGQADGIVCAYLDRWARNMEALEMIERWTKQGKTFISARERFDANTSAGRFTLGMMLLVAKHYRDRITEGWETSVKNAVERGVHVTVPYGYRRGDGNGRPHRKGGTRGAPLVAERAPAEVVRRIFTERAQGVGISTIGDGLNSDGIISPRGGRWTRQAVRALLRVRAYMGEASRGEYVLENAHEPIVSREEWEAAQTERAPAKQNGHSLLVGLVRLRRLRLCDGRRLVEARRPPIQLQSTTRRDALPVPDYRSRGRARAAGDRGSSRPLRRGSRAGCKRDERAGGDLGGCVRGGARGIGQVA
jgi:DNA invertase Pin-like site-specific DNA recombinase